jgi:subtilisin family serine protease
MDDKSDTVLAVKEAINEGIFVVAAAGNTGLDESIYDISTPANVEGVISVAASNKKGSIWGNSAIGNEIDPYTDYERVFPNQKPEISAPGVRLLSTYSTGSSDSLYAYSSGTSDSTVLVTGALALLLEIYGEDIAGEDNVISYDELIQVKVALAKSTESDIQGSNHDLKRGYGMLNVNLWAEEIKNEFDFN